MLWTAEIVILYDIQVLKSESEALLNNYFVKKAKIKTKTKKKKNVIRDSIHKWQAQGWNYVSLYRRQRHESSDWQPVRVRRAGGLALILQKKTITWNRPTKLTRPCEQGNWDTWMVLDPWNQV